MKGGRSRGSSRREHSLRNWSAKAILVSYQEMTVDDPAFQEFVEKLYADFIVLGPGSRNRRPG